jgi:hypothetical protein
MSNSINKYIKLFEEELAGLRAVGVSEPEDSEESSLPEVNISFQHDTDNSPKKSVMVNAGGIYTGDADDLRNILRDMDVPIPDEDAQPNDSGVWVSVDENGKRITAMADNEKGDELLAMLKNAGLYKGGPDA